MGHPIDELEIDFHKSGTRDFLISLYDHLVELGENPESALDWADCCYFSIGGEYGN